MASRASAGISCGLDLFAVAHKEVRTLIQEPKTVEGVAVLGDFGG